VPALPVGLEVVNPTFRAFLDLVGEGPQPQEIEAPELLDDATPVAAPAGPTVADLLAAAASCGVDRAALLVAARHYCGVSDLDRLAPEQVVSLLDRMRSRYGAGGDSAGISGDDVEVSAPKRRSRAA
jgi:hypothetical protein